MLPNLIHPVDVTIEQIDQGGTFYDDDAREPIQVVGRSAQIVVKGQIKWGSQFDTEYQKTGVVEGAKGYVLFRKVDLDAATITLQLNDRILKMGHVETDVYVKKLEWMGHYPDQDGPALVRAYFEDRQPAHQSRG